MAKGQGLVRISIQEESMNPIAEILLEQVARSREIGRQILEASGLNEDGVIYAFATPEVLVINCKDYTTTWRFDEGQGQLQQAIAQLKSSIRTILVEKAGKTFYSW
jgi:hypothetical protein